MGGRMYLGNQMVTPVIVDYRCSFADITGEPTDNEALAHALDEKQNVISDLDSIRSGANAGSTALQPSALNGYATESWVTGKGYITGITSSDVTTALGYTPYSSANPNGYTSNTGTITGITMNGVSKGTSGVVDLGTVITEHQSLSGYEQISNKVTSLSSSSTDMQYPSAKCVYDLVGDIESALNTINSGV